MPEMDGFEATGDHSEQGTGISGTLRSTHSRPMLWRATGNGVWSAGMDDYISKPIGLDELRRESIAVLQSHDAGKDRAAVIYPLQVHGRGSNRSRAPLRAVFFQRQGDRWKPRIGLTHLSPPWYIQEIQYDSLGRPGNASTRRKVARGVASHVMAVNRPTESSQPFKFVGGEGRRREGTPKREDASYNGLIPSPFHSASNQT